MCYPHVLPRQHSAIIGLEYFVRGNTRILKQHETFLSLLSNLSYLRQIYDHLDDKIQTKHYLSDTGQVNTWRYYEIILVSHLKSLLSHVLYLSLSYSVFPSSSAFSLWAFYWTICLNQRLYKHWLSFAVYGSRKWEIFIIFLNLLGF